MSRLDQIEGLHHVTAMAGDAQANNAFFTKTLGLRRVKKTVNFDAPDVYHLYYGDEIGRPGSIMTYFPFPNMGRGRPGTGEVGKITFSIPEGTLPFWLERLNERGVDGLKADEIFGEKRLQFFGPDGDGLAVIEAAADRRVPWTAGGIAADNAIRGFHSVSLRLQDDGATAKLLTFMGYEPEGEQNGVKRLRMPGGNGADTIDIETLPDLGRAASGTGSVHHIAFAVADRGKQLEVREALLDEGYQVTPVIDRDYFWAIYFRAPGGVLFEVATDEPGFARDEEPAHLGEALKLPKQHEHLRDYLDKHLAPITD